ncbi:MAG: J domain-containing protein [Acidimicrobiales bacterium]
MDPWEVLGLDPARSTADTVRAAKRRLAKLHHPDVVAGGGGGPGEVAAASARLVAVNQAVELALADLTTRGPERPAPAHVPMPAPSAADAAIWAAGEDAADATFSVPGLPVDAFELLLLAFSAIGDPKVVDEPYLLEGQVDDPFLGVARVELAPEAGGSLVTVTTWPLARAVTPAPTPAQVAGRLLWEVRALG